MREGLAVAVEMEMRAAYDDLWQVLARTLMDVFMHVFY